MLVVAAPFVVCARRSASLGLREEGIRSCADRKILANKVAEVRLLLFGGTAEGVGFFYVLRSRCGCERALSVGSEAARSKLPDSGFGTDSRAAMNRAVKCLCDGLCVAACRPPYGAAAGYALSPQ
jgi:hypothetical protein